MLIHPVDASASSPASAREDVPVSTFHAAATPVATAAPAVAVAASTATPLRDVVIKANAAMRQLTQAIEFEVDETTHQTVVKLIDTHDRSVLRQIPSEEMLDIARALEHMQAVLLRSKA